MSTDKNNIDQMFSDAAQSEKAPQYNSKYWAEMNSILNARDNKKKGFVFWAFGGSAIFAVLIISLFTLNMDNSFTEKRYAKEETTLYIEEVNLSGDQSSTSHISETHLNKNKASEQNRLNNEENRNSILPENESLLVHQNSDKENTISTNRNSFNKEDSENGINSSNKNSREIAIENFEPQAISIGKLEQKMFLPYTATYYIAQSKSGNIIGSTYNIKAPPTFRLYAKFSGGLMENYKTSRPYESGLIDLSLNVEMNMNNVLLRSGIGTQLTSNADLIVSQRKQINDIIVINLQKDLSYQNLIDIYIPLELGYRLNNTSFGAGAQVNFLLTTSMDLNNYENKVLVNTEKKYGNRNGLNSFSTQGYIWIEQRFSPMISLGLKTGTNISGRIKDGEYFNESATTNPIYGQVSLKVNLIK